MITYTRQKKNEGMYTIIGSFRGSEPAAVVIETNGGESTSVPYSLSEARDIVEKAINRGTAKAQKYVIRDANPPEDKPRTVTIESGVTTVQTVPEEVTQMLDTAITSLPAETPVESYVDGEGRTRYGTRPAGEPVKPPRTPRQKKEAAAPVEGHVSGTGVGKQKLDVEKITQMFKNGCSVRQIEKAGMGSYMGVRLLLIRAGLLVIPAK